MTINFSRRPGSIDDADTLFGFLDPRLLAGLTPTNQVGTKSAPVETAGHDDALHADPFYYIYDDHAVPSDLTDSYVTSGGKWGPSGTFGTTGGTVTWSIAGSGWTNQTGTTFFNGSTVSMSSVLNFDYVSVLQQAFAAWSAVANINFVQVADGGGNFGVGTNGYIRIGTGYIDGLGDSNGSILAYGFYPGSAGAPQGFAYSGDIVFDSGENSSFWNANSFLAVATHEIGHALGLRHSSDFGALMYPNYNPNILTPQTDDINGIRSIYGAATSSAGSVSISDVTITEGNSGTQFATFTARARAAPRPLASTTPLQTFLQLQAATMAAVPARFRSRAVSTRRRSRLRSMATRRSNQTRLSPLTCRRPPTAPPSPTARASAPSSTTTTRRRSVRSRSMT